MARYVEPQMRLMARKERTTSARLGRAGLAPEGVSAPRERASMGAAALSLAMRKDTQPAARESSAKMDSAPAEMFRLVWGRREREIRRGSACCGGTRPAWRW